ncbi:hypothetical protein [Lapillicoccus sp.]|uniref:hypothetical protein n=1 Tax=Lapillicoccus sp. TaxID=1909287 RepID=UPI0025DAD641|nr:hypothetical protein [Lapillicoccus sp.]
MTWSRRRVLMLVAGSGESPPAAVDAVNDLCRDAARASWWWGTVLLAAGVVVALGGLPRGRRPAPQQRR